MKYKILYNQLNEGLGTVYHATNVKSAVKILSDDCFELSPAVGSAAETNISKNKYYYFSTMRTITSRYMTSDRHKISSVAYNLYFVLDADKLSHNLKSTSVDYWNSDNFTENEERYLSNIDKICPAHKYIKSIHILVDDRHLEWDKERKSTVYLSNIVQIGWNAKDKVYYYDNVKDYITRRNHKKLTDILKLTKDELEDKLDWTEIHKHKSKTKNNIDYVLQFYSGDKIPTKTVKKFQTYFYGGVDSAYAHDFINQLLNEIHGSRRSNSENRTTIKEFIDLMKKHKKKDVTKFIKEVFYPDLKKKFKLN